MESKAEKIQKESEQILDLLRNHGEWRHIEDIQLEFKPDQ